MVSFVAHVIGELFIPFLGRSFWRFFRRFPIAFAFAAVAGQIFGVWLIDYCWPAGDWAMVALGVLCLVFYTGLLGLVTVKWWSGTWRGFCDYAESLFE